MLCLIAPMPNGDQVYLVRCEVFKAVKDYDSWTWEREVKKIAKHYGHLWFAQGENGETLFYPPVAKLRAGRLYAHSGRHRAAVLSRWGSNLLPLSIAYADDHSRALFSQLEPRAIAPGESITLPDLPICYCPEV